VDADDTDYLLSGSYGHKDGKRANSQKDQGSLNLHYGKKTDPFIVTTGLHSDYTSDFYFSPGGHAGLSYEMGKQTIVKGNVGYSENIPSFGQLYQPSHGSMDQVTGNPDLEKEKIFSLSLGIAHTFDNKTQLDLSLFRTDTRDLIKYNRGADLISRPENISLAYKQGLEASFTFFLSQASELDLNYIWQNTNNKDNDKKLSYAPEHTLKLILKTKFKTGTRLELIARGYTEQYTDTLNTESERIKAYISTGVKILHPVLMMKKKAEFFVHLHNLFDTDYSSHYGYPDDGFKVLAGMNINF